MKRSVLALAGFVLALLLSVGAAGTASATQWRHPGHHPLAGDRESVMNETARRANFIRLGLSGPMLEKVMAVTATHGDMRDLVDGENLGDQLYQGGHLEHEVVVAFGTQRVDRTAERWRIVFDDGTVIEVTLPYICHNLSVKVIRPKKPSCNLIVFETRYSSEHLSHHPVYGNAESSKCFGIRDLDATAFKSGKIRFTTTVREIQSGCIRRVRGCNYDGADRKAAPRIRTRDGSYPDLTVGLHAVLVDPRFSSDPAAAFGVCVEWVDENGGLHTSETAIATNIDYTMTVDGRQVARVYYQKSELPATIKEDGPGYTYLYEQ